MAEPIRNQKPSVAPTPQNTPASVSTLQSQTPLSRAQPGMASISEGNTDVGSMSALMGLIQGRLGGLAGSKSNYIDSLPKPVRERIAALKGLRTKQAKIEGEFHRELLELEKKYLVKQQPLYDERRKLIAGDTEAKPDDIEHGEAAFEEEKEMFGSGSNFDDDEDEEDDDENENENENEKKSAKSSSKVKFEDDDEEAADGEAENIKGVPGFWLTAFRNVPHLTDMIYERDVELLNSLVDVRLKYLSQPGFELEFEFVENPYFSNKTLKKTYYYHEDIGLTGDFMFDHATGTDIKWVSPEQNVTVRVEKRKQRNKHTKATRTIEKTLPEQSFFNFFSPPKVPGPEDEEDEEDDEYAQSLHAELELDFELGEFFKEKLIPRAIDWFTGRAIDYEGLGEVDEDEEDGEDVEYDDEDDEDDEEGGVSVLDSEALKKEVPENCKQQ